MFFNKIILRNAIFDQKKLFICILVFLQSLQCSSLSFAPQTYESLTAEEMIGEMDEAAILHRWWNTCRQVYNSPFQKFFRKYSLPEEIRKKIADTPYHRAKEGYFYEGSNIARIVNAERARNCITKNTLNLLTVPKKSICRDDTYKNDLRVYAEEMSPFIGKLSLEEVQQLVKFAEETNFSDWGYEGYSFNWGRDKDGKLVCLDLEDRSFTSGSIDHPGSFQLRKLLRHSMSDEAAAWLIEKIKFWDKQEKKIVRLPLSQNKIYDDPDIDFEIVKQFYTLSTSNDK